MIRQCDLEYPWKARESIPVLDQLVNLQWNQCCQNLLAESDLRDELQPKISDMKVDEI